LAENKICILPCNGLDKSLGVIARQVALKVIEKNPKIELICPVLLNTGDANYENLIKTSKLVLIDGCMTRCATKLSEKQDSKIIMKILVPDMSKKFKIKPCKTLTLDQQNEQLVDLISELIVEDLNKTEEKKISVSRELEKLDYFDVTVDKYYFRVPKVGYFFNENDCWIKSEGTKAMLGITDYLQNAASDILFVDLPEIGVEIEQFDDIGSFESSKTVLQLISPGAGKIISVNKELKDHPEYINQDPYGKGWFIELELKNFEEDKELLMDGPTYFEYMKNKIMKEKNHLSQLKSEKND